MLDEFIRDHQSLSKEMHYISRALLANQQGGILKQMSVSPKQPLHCRTTLGVVIHATSVFFNKQKIDLLLPFVSMLKNPVALSVSNILVLVKSVLNNSAPLIDS